MSAAAAVVQLLSAPLAWRDGKRGELVPGGESLGRERLGRSWSGFPLFAHVPTQRAYLADGGRCRTRRFWRVVVVVVVVVGRRAKDRRGPRPKDRWRRDVGPASVFGHNLIPQTDFTSGVHFQITQVVEEHDDGVGTGGWESVCNGTVGVGLHTQIKKRETKFTRIR